MKPLSDHHVSSGGNAIELLKEFHRKALFSNDSNLANFRLSVHAKHRFT